MPLDCHGKGNRLNITKSKHLQANIAPRLTQSLETSYEKRLTEEDTDSALHILFNSADSLLSFLALHHTQN